MVLGLRARIIEETARQLRSEFSNPEQPSGPRRTTWARAGSSGAGRRASPAGSHTGFSGTVHLLFSQSYVDSVFSRVSGRSQYSGVSELRTRRQVAHKGKP